MKLPNSVSISDMVTYAWRIAVLVGIGAMLYLRSIFATEQGVNDRIVPIAQLISSIHPRVQNLEEWKNDQKALQALNDSKISQMEQDLSSIKAFQSEAARNTERILRRLDSGTLNP